MALFNRDPNRDLNYTNYPAPKANPEPRLPEVPPLQFPTPAVRRPDPLSAKVDPTFAEAIRVPAEAYIKAILDPIKADFERIERYYNAALAWADGVRQQTEARIQDITDSRQEMRDVLNKYLEVPGAVDPEAPSVISEQPNDNP